MIQNTGSGGGNMALTIFLYILMIAEYYSFCYVFFNKSPDKITKKAYIGSILVLGPVEYLLLYVLMVLWNFPPVINNVLYTLVIILVVWLYYITIIKKNSNFIKIPIKLKAIIILAIASIVFMIAFIIYNMFSLNKKSKIIGILVITGGVLGVLILLLLIIYYLNDIQKQYMKNSILEQYNKQQKEYYQNVLKRETSTKQFRHDIINHLMELQSFSKARAYDKLDSYLNNILEDISSINNSQYDVGNIVINTMLDYYLIPLKNNCNIIIEGYISDKIMIEDTDMCIIVSNVIKNAVEAASQIKSTSKEILFSVNQGEKFLKLCVENTIEKEVYINKNGQHITTKSDKENHGFGISNIQKVIKKYRGLYNVYAGNGRYKVEIILKSGR